MSMNVPLMRPVGPPILLIEKYLNEIFENGVFSNFGPLVQRLEDRLAKYFNVDKQLVVLCSNATQGIAGSSFISSIDQYICPSFTFPGSALGLLHSGKKIFFADIDPETWELDISKIDHNNNFALQVVLPFGRSPDFDKFRKFKNIIFDAAASIGNDRLDLSHLEEKWVAVFSLHATKVLGIGEGGVVVFGNKNDALNFRKFINFGFWGDRTSQVIGTNIKISEYSAAIGHAVLDNIEQEFDEWNVSRNKTKELEKKLQINSFSSHIQSHNPYWIIVFDSKDKANFVKEKLVLDGIGNRQWWSNGLHNMPIFSAIPKIGTLINTDIVSNTYLGLPFYRSMSDSDLAKIEDSLLESLKLI